MPLDSKAKSDNILGVIEIRKSWREFKQTIEKLVSQRRSESRRTLVFRGQSDSKWELQTTLDRFRSFKSDRDRNEFQNRLLSEFRRESIALGDFDLELPEGDALALLARHHGVPTSWLDFTVSPFVAAYFAFAEARPEVNSVAVFGINRSKLPDDFPAGDVIDDPELVRFNRRALKQRSIFVRVPSIQRPVSQVLGDALAKWIIPRKDRELALAELDEMSINATSLFWDLDGVARTVTARML